MNKRELDLLENVFSCQIESAVNKGIGLYQTKSKLAKKLEDEGFLVKRQHVIYGRFPVTIEGYELTIAGNMAYCFSDRCKAELEGE